MVLRISPARWRFKNKARSPVFLITIIILTIIYPLNSGFCQSEIKIAGKVIDGITSNPVPGAAISIINNGKTSISDINGEFYFNDIPKGNYRLTARRLGYRQSRESEFSVGAYLSETVIISLTPVPIEVEGQLVSSSKAGRLTIRRNGNTTILEIGKDRLFTLDDLQSELPEIEIVRSGAEKYLRIRGANLNATEIKLNGRKINSVLTSKGDISSIPMGSVIRIEFTKGGSYKTAGTAGSVNFITVSDFDKFGISSGIERGSFDRNKYSIRFSNAQLFGLSVALDMENSFDRGDFEFVDPRDSLQTRENNYFHDKKLFGSALYRSSETDLIFNINLFKRGSGVPGQVFQPTPNANSDIYEKDFSLKYISKLTPKTMLNITAGLTNRSIEHESPRTIINFIPYKSSFKENARDFAARFQYDGGIDFNIGAKSRYESLHGEDFIRPASSFGRHSRTVNSIQGGAVFHLVKFDRLKNNTIISAGAKYEEGGGGGFFAPSAAIRINFDLLSSPAFDFSWSKARRLPDMTDLYWKEDVFASPNPELKPEKSTGYEIGFDFKIERIISSEFRLSRHLRTYDDLIIWRRWAGNRFKPVNLSEAEISGWEFSAKSNPFSGPISFYWTASFIRPLNKENEPSHHDKFLTFRPIGTQTAGFEIRYRGMELRFVGRHLGQRYLTEENTKSLPPTDLLDMRINYSRDFAMVKINPGFEILNIGDIQYEILDRQPERPREYRMNLTIVK